MSTLDNVLLIVLTSFLSILMIVGIALVIIMIRVALAIKKVALRAEEVVESVEEAADVLRDTQGRLAVFKLVRNIIKLMNKR
jgi:hypothetical protein